MKDDQKQREGTCARETEIPERDERVLEVASEILQKYREAFEELAK